jgi:hypothetical protein
VNDYDLPDPDDLTENYYNPIDHGYSMDPEKGDKDNDVSQEELDNIDKFLKDFDKRNYPPEDYIF